MEHQLRPPRGFVDIFNPFSLKNLESHTVRPKEEYFSEDSTSIYVLQITWILPSKIKFKNCYASIQ